jgi:hypothetical protein
VVVISEFSILLWSKPFGLSRSFGLGPSRTKSCVVIKVENGPSLFYCLQCIDILICFFIRNPSSLNNNSDILFDINSLGEFKYRTFLFRLLT